MVYFKQRHIRCKEVLPMRIAICDDDSTQLKLTGKLIEAWASERNVAVNLFPFPNGDRLIHAHEKAPFDLLFLDIFMPGFTGMDVAKEIRHTDKKTDIVFLTSTPDFAVESYSVAAKNYLLKPVNEEALRATLDQILKNATRHRKSIVVKTGNAFHRLFLEEIEFVEAINRGTSFMLSNGETVQTARPFHEFENELAEESAFFKCHRSYIVNIMCIDTYAKNEIKMLSGKRIPISRSCSAAFEDVYFAQMFGKTEDGQ